MGVVMLRAVIFDMDGLMVDTERLHHESFKTVLEQYGITPVPNAMGVIPYIGHKRRSKLGAFQKAVRLQCGYTRAYEGKNRCPPKAAAKLGMSPAERVVLEDAMNGMRAGKAAGMYVIVVPNEFTQDEDFDAADPKVSSLRQVSGEKFASLL